MQCAKITRRQSKIGTDKRQISMNLITGGNVQTHLKKKPLPHVPIQAGWLGQDEN